MHYEITRRFIDIFLFNVVFDFREFVVNNRSLPGRSSNLMHKIKSIACYYVVARRCSEVIVCFLLPFIRSYFENVLRLKK